MAHVVGEIEALVVDPDGMPLDRREGEPLTVVGDQMKSRSDVLSELLDIRARRGSRDRVEASDRGDMGRQSLALEQDEGGVLRRQALVCGSPHRLPV